MTPPPDAVHGAAGLPWPTARIPARALPRLGEGHRLLGLAICVLAIALAGTVALREVPASLAGLATRTTGTAFLQSATCADWNRAGPARRSVIASTLAVAATAPDPESAGATLDEGGTFNLFSRACSTVASRNGLLYEIYNRAASFQALDSGATMGSGGFGTALHH